MPLSLNSNLPAVNVTHRIGRNQSDQVGGMEKLGSGLRIRRASHDAAGLSISEGLRSQVTRLGQNVKNAEQATDLLRVAEGSLDASTSLLQRMRSLATSSQKMRSRKRWALVAVSMTAPGPRSGQPAKPAPISVRDWRTEH